MTDEQGAGRGLVVAAVLVALVPLAVAAVRAVAQDWVPVGDNAFLRIATGDVFSAHPPLLGSATSVSSVIGKYVNHPGPLLFDWLAVPLAIWPGGAGLVVGVGLLNATATGLVGWIGWRRGGAPVALAAVAAAAALAWSIGSSMLVEPWPPHAVLLPFFAFLVAVWAVADGDAVVLPVAAALASLVVQSHVSYVFLISALTVWALTGLWLRTRRADDGARRRARHGLAVTAAVLVACWVQPLIEQLQEGGSGNLVNLADAARSDLGPELGPEVAVRVLGSGVAVPPAWARPSFGEAFVPKGSDLGLGYTSRRPRNMRSFPVAAAGLVVAAGAVGTCMLVARRRRDAVAGTAATTAAVGLLVALFTATRTPVGLFGLVPHEVRWVWPLGAFVALAVVTSVVRGRVARPVTLALLGAIVGLAGWNVAPYEQAAGPLADAWAMDSVRGISPQLRDLRGRGTILVDTSSIRPFDPVLPAVMAELQRHDVPFVAAGPGISRQVGEHRRFDGDNAVSALSLVVGPDARAAPKVGERVAFRDGLTAAGRRELDRAKVDLRRRLSVTTALRPTTAGRKALARGEFPVTTRWLQGDVDADALLFSGELITLTRMGFVRADTLLRRYAQLQLAENRETIAIVLRPL